MTEQTKRIKVQVDIVGPIWFIGWLFTLAYANLGLWQALLAILIWPYFLGNAVS